MVLSITVARVRRYVSSCINILPRYVVVVVRRGKRAKKEGRGRKKRMNGVVQNLHVTPAITDRDSS